MRLAQARRTRRRGSRWPARPSGSPAVARSVTVFEGAHPDLVLGGVDLASSEAGLELGDRGVLARRDAAPDRPDDHRDHETGRDERHGEREEHRGSEEVEEVESASRRQRSGGARPMSAPDDEDLARELRQAGHAAGRRVERDQVLDAHAGLTLEIDARLDREDRRARQRRVGCGRAEARRLVRGQADPVPRPVAEVRAVAGGLDDRPGDRVDRVAARESRSAVPARPAGHRGLERLDGGRLGPRDELVDGEIARRRVADEERPGHVAPVARDLGAEVEQQDRARQHRPVAGSAVRQGRLGPGQAGDVEGERLRATGPDQPLEPQRQRRLGHAGPDLREQGRERPVADRTGRRDALDLRRAPWSPGPPRPSPRPARAPRPAPPRRADPTPRAGSTPASMAIRFAPDRRDQLRPARRQVAIDVDQAGVRGLAAGLDRVPRVGEQHQVVPADEELARRAGDLLLAVAQGEARQVAHVLRADAEVRVDIRIGEARAQALETSRPGSSVGLGPGGPLAVGRRGGEVSRLGEPTAHV